jgi:hypothetical protein
VNQTDEFDLVQWLSPSFRTEEPIETEFRSKLRIHPAKIVAIARANNCLFENLHRHRPRLKVDIGYQWFKCQIPSSTLSKKT